MSINNGGLIWRLWLKCRGIRNTNVRAEEAVAVGFDLVGYGENGLVILQKEVLEGDDRLNWCTSI